MVVTGQRARLGQVLVVSICVALAALIGRLVYINTKLAPRLQAWSYERQTSTIELPGRRGAILDHRYRVLAGSIDRYVVYADPRLVADHEEAAAALAKVLSLKQAEIVKKLDHPTSPAYVVLYRGEDDLRTAIKDLDITGAGVQREPGRAYPMGKLAAHVIGAFDAEGRWLEGVELAMNSVLKSKPGKRVVFCDLQRRAVFSEPDAYVAPQDGKHVLLTIDATIQEKLEEQLKTRVEYHSAECAVGIVMDPNTGEVLAMANYPTFEPIRAGEFPMEVRRNRLLTDPVEPGSVFKPFVMSAVLAAGLTKPSESIFVHDGLYITGKRQLRDHHAYHTLTVEQIVAHSSNIGMAILGQRLGNAKMCLALRMFGFGRPSGIDLPGEGEGLLMPLKAWNSYSTTSVPMGQELAVTPMQLVTAFCSIVNGGTLLKPRVIAGVLDDSGEFIDDRREVKQVGQSLDPQTAEVMKSILAKVVTEGTGKGCQLENWQVMGKTGTAQVPRRKGRGYEPGAYLASFMAAAPMKKPAVVVLVMVRKPMRNNYYGSQVALPAVKEILQFTLDYLGVPHEPPITTDKPLMVDSRD